MATDGKRDGTTAAAAPAARGWGWGLAAALLFVALVHGLWWLFGDVVVHRGGLADGDAYLRLVRVERLIETGGWFDPTLPRINAPYGGALHWTRPLDVLLAALALPMQPFLGLTRALYWAGALLGPALHLALAAALAWATRPLLGPVAAAIAGGLTASQFGVLGYALVGHADHHVLLALFAVVAFGFVLRALAAETGAQRPAVAAGLALAAGMWVSAAEAEVAAALALAVLGVRWIAAGGGFLATNRRLAVGLVLGLALALLAERGPAGLLAVEYDRVSVVHLTAAGLVFLFWSLVAAGPGGRKDDAGRRLAAALAGALLAVVVLWLAFPQAFTHPLAGADPLIKPVLDGIAEFARLRDAPHALLYLGAALPVLPWAAWRVGRAWKAADPGRWAWLLLALHAAVYAALTAMWIRWSLYAGVFLAAILADLLARADAAIDRRFGVPARLPVKLAVVLALTVGPIAAGAAALIAAPGPKAAGLEACPLAPLAKFLETPPWSERPRTIAASVNFGPELLYRTRHRVLATLHHRNAAAIRDGILILGGKDDAEILKLVRRRGVELILICEKGPHDAYFKAGRGDNILYRRLERGEPPPWLGPVALPAAAGESFRLFEVAPPG